MLKFKEFITEEQAKKGLHVFDVDGVAFHPNALVHVNDEHGKRVESLDHHAFNTHQLKPGHKYDFSEFKDSNVFQHGKPIHATLRKIRAIQKNGGHVAFNTARSDFDDKDKVLDKFEKHGVDMSKAHLHRAGNEPGHHPTGEKKNRVLRRILDRGEHSHVHFYDDDKENLRHFNKLATEYPHIKFHAWHVQHDGSTKAFNEGHPRSLPKIEIGIGNRNRGEVNEDVDSALHDEHAVKDPKAAGALKKYAAYSAGLNKSLRTGSKMHPSDAVIHKGLQNAFSKPENRVPPEKVKGKLYTGVRHNPADLFRHHGLDPNNPDHYVDVHVPGYGSTSTDVATAHVFSGLSTRDGGEYDNAEQDELKARSHNGVGRHVFAIKPTSRTEMMSARDHSEHHSEQEMVLKNSSVMRIHGAPKKVSKKLGGLTITANHWNVTHLGHVD